jgi:tetratricopeptide (TPR) repeat protein
MMLRTLTLALGALLSGTAAAERLKLCQQALEVLRQGDAAAAVELQERCIARAGATQALPVLYVSLGDYRYAAGQYAQAVAAFDRAAELRPGANASLLTRRGRARFELGEDDAARADFDAALAVDPDAEATHFALARLFERQGRRDEARAAFLRAFNLGERSPEMLRRVREYGFTVPEMPTRQDPPLLTPDAFRRCKSSRVMLKVTTDDLGLPVDIAVEQSSGDAELDRRAMEAAR